MSYLSSVDMFYVLIVWLQKHLFIFHATKWTQSTRFLHSLVPKQVSINDSLHHWYHCQKIYTQPGRMITLHSIFLPNWVIIGPYEPSIDPRADKIRYTLRYYVHCSHDIFNRFFPILLIYTCYTTQNILNRDQLHFLWINGWQNNLKS